MNWISVQDTVDPDHPYAPIAVEIASNLLFQLTGEKFQGIHSVTEYYTKDGSASLSYQPELIDGQMYNLPVSSLSSRPRASGQSMGDRNLYLRHNPVLSVQSVSISGNVLDPSTYTIRNRKYLVRNGHARWIFDSNTEVVVSYTYGANPPKAGIAAATRLANELIWAESGDEQCSLPATVTSVDRKGISITVTDPQQFLDQGKVGIYEVDMFIRAYNPTGSLKKTRLAVAGRPRSERIN